jgi:hypothetical protein
MQNVLYGVWPMMLGGALMTFIWHKYRTKAAVKFEDPNIDRSRLKKVHKFSSPGEN